ncbi:MAG: iron-sulfur cluster insertion protein ErpA [Parvularculaceae bacterium]
MLESPLQLDEPLTIVADVPVTLSERAVTRIAQILAKEPAGSMLRVAVNGGGCSGFQYDFDIVKASSPDDLVVERGGVRVLIDPVSLDFLKGSEIDFANELIGSAFKIKNPNATSSCGCGTSFSV